MLRYFYDCEFIDTGRSIELISIGIVSSDGTEFYGVNADLDEAAVLAVPWLSMNVWPHLPHVGSRLDRDHPDVKPRPLLARKVQQFLTLLSPRDEERELWGWYSAYDHVALCQLLAPTGRMIDLPEGVPMRTNDLAQHVQSLQPPPGGVDEHHALADAKAIWKTWSDWQHPKFGRARGS